MNMNMLHAINRDILSIFVKNLKDKVLNGSKRFFLSTNTKEHKKSIHNGPVLKLPLPLSNAVLSEFATDGQN